MKLENHFYGKFFKAALYAIDGDKEKSLNVDLSGYARFRIYLLLEMKSSSFIGCKSKPKYCWLI